MRALRPQHRASPRGCATHRTARLRARRVLGLAVVFAAALPCRPLPLSAAEAGGEEYHVTLSGEDRGAMSAPPIRPDAPFALPEWSPGEALAELVRAPLSGSGWGGHPPVAVGTGEPGRRAGGLARPSAQADGPAAEESAGEAAGDPAGDPAEEPSGPAASPLPSPAPAVDPRPADAPASTLPGDVRPAPAVLPSPGGLRSAGTAYSGASLGLSYRPGHRLSASGTLEIRLPRFSVESRIDVLAPDDLVPSPLGSTGGLLGRVRCSASLRSLGFWLDAFALASELPGEELSSSGAAAVELSWTKEKGSVETVSELAAISGEASSTRIAFHQGIEGRVSVGPTVALRGAVDATLSRADTAAGAAYALLLAEIRPRTLPLLLSCGAALTTDGVGVGWLPALGLDASLGGGWRVGAEAGPFARTQDTLPRLLLELPAPSAAPAPERGFSARAYAEMDSAGGEALTMEIEYADGLLWLVDQGELRVAAARRLAGSFGASLPLREDATVRIELGSTAAWLDGSAIGVPDVAVRALLRAGFWQAGLAAILFGLSGTGSAAMPADGVEALGGFQLAARLGRSFARGGSLSTEARILYREEVLTLAVELGGSIGVP